MSSIRIVADPRVPKDMVFIAREGKIVGGGRQDPNDGWVIYDPHLARGMADLLGVTFTNADQ